MTIDRDTTRIVRSWLRTEEHESANRVLDAVLDQLDTTPQRRATWWPARRLPIMSNTAKFGVAAAIVAIAALLGFNYLVAPNVGSPGVESPSPDPSLSLLPPEGELAAGTYSLGPDFPVPLTFEVPQGWATGRTSDVEIGLFHDDRPGISFGVVENVVANPCGVALLDSPAGRSVGEMVEAISGLDRFEATSASDITVDGYAGQEFEITAPEASTCGLYTWWNGQRVNGVGLGETNRLRIIDVNGTLLMIAIAYQPALLTDPGSLADAQTVVDSVTSGP